MFDAPDSSYDSVPSTRVTVGVCRHPDTPYRCLLDDRA